MKIKEGFILQDVAGETVVLPVDAALDMNMMITLNDTARFLWELLQQECTEQTLVQGLLSTYEVDEKTAVECVKNFVKELAENGFLA